MSDLSKDVTAESEEQNPYAPSLTPPTEGSYSPLPPAFWSQVFIAFLCLGVLAFFVPGLGVPALICLIAAAVRVPLLKKRLLKKRAAAVDNQPLPNLSVLLFTSWIIMLAVGFASVVTFVLICFPAGLLAFSVDSRGDSIWVIVPISGVVALTAFAFLFRFSLRLPI